MTEDDAREVAGWGYATLAGLAPLLDRDRAYYSIANAEGEVVGCCCFGPEARQPGGDYAAPGPDFAAWLRPDLTGFGRGARFVITVLTFARALFGALPFRTTVPAANQPALYACRRAGFRPILTFTAADGAKYLQLGWEIS
jgi:RimJ/RimL family protein N-acetyltransferase